MTLRLLGLLLAASLVPTMHCSPREEKRSIHVAVAMSLLPAIQDAAGLFEQRNPNIDVLLNGGASGRSQPAMIRSISPQASSISSARANSEPSPWIASSSNRSYASGRALVPKSSA